MTLRPAARTTDPQTSWEAAESIADTRMSLVNRVVALVREQPGLIREELAERLGLEQYALSKRLSDAEDAGLITKGEPRYARNGRRQSTWWPIVEPMWPLFS